MPTALLNTIANSLAACVNSAGSSSAGCSNLFTAAPNPDGTVPANTIVAALNIARNPSRNVQAIINDGSPNAIFAPTVASANDLTLAVTYTGGGLSSPSAAAIDTSGNVWVANSTANMVTEVSHTGTFVSGTAGYAAGGLNLPSAIAFDASGNAWVTNAGNSTLTELTSAGTAAAGPPFSGGGLSTPSSIAFDLLGNSWISNSGNSSISEFNGSGVALSGTGYKPAGVAGPFGIAINPR